jgi:TP901-1 family phage major tail protein
MAAQRGRDLLLKVDATGSGGFQTVAGLRSNAITFNAGSVDVTHQESAGQWRELLAGAGLKSAAVRGSGIFRDAASDATVRGLFFSGHNPRMAGDRAGFRRGRGLFQIASLEFGGRHDGEVTFDLALESAGEISFTAI